MNYKSYERRKEEKIWNLMKEENEKKKRENLI